jgi:class 3 adenylate cyclase
VGRPPTRYAYAPDGAALAYQVSGDGPVDLLYVPQTLCAIDVLWEHPRTAAFFERLASFSRLILFDRRGSGLSSRWGAPLTLEEQIDDVRAVMDAAGSESAAVMALLEGGPMAMLFAASMPERVTALALYSSFARMTWAEDYDWALHPEEREAALEPMVEHWGAGFGLDIWAPSHVGDASLQEWLGMLQRRSMAPDEWRRLFEVMGQVDLRPVLPTIRVPTLVLHRPDALAIDVRHSRYIAEHIPGARYVELPGEDHLVSLGDSEAVHGEIEEFLTGRPRSGAIDRRLLTVLFTDIVGGTARAARDGDARWRSVLSAHDAEVRRQLARFGGREVKTTGDGFLAVWDGPPSQAVRCGRAIVEATATLGVDVRAGLHTGECEAVGDDVAGMAVNIASRVCALASAGEVLASGTTYGTVVGSALAFDDAGSHALRGVPGRWPVFRVR